nr:hypothetical protein [Actinomadura madurae]
MIEKDADGEPTGVLRETARDLIAPHVPPFTDDEVSSALDRAVEVLHGLGITSVTDPGIDLGGSPCTSGRRGRANSASGSTCCCRRARPPPGCATCSAPTGRRAAWTPACCASPGSRSSGTASRPPPRPRGCTSPISTAATAAS